VLEGAVQRDQVRVRVNAQFLDAETGAHLWADRFAEDLADLFKLKDDAYARFPACSALRLPFPPARGQVVAAMCMRYNDTAQVMRRRSIGCMPRRESDADNRKFFDEFESVRVPRLRAMGVIDPAKRQAISFGRSERLQGRDKALDRLIAKLETTETALQASACELGRQVPACLRPPSADLVHATQAGRIEA
jgi:hypothetical protein